MLFASTGIQTQFSGYLGKSESPLRDRLPCLQDFLKINKKKETYVFGPHF